MEPKYDPDNLFLKTYNYDEWFENEESTDKEESSDEEESVDLSDMPALNGDDEVKKENKKNIKY